MSYDKPLPRITPDNKPFWDSCKRHALAIPHCEDCARAYWPPGPVCPTCFGERVGWKPASGHATIASWVVVHKAWFPAFTGDIPYNVAHVELEEGVRITASIVGLANEAMQVGLPVVVVYDDVTPEVTLPRFKPQS